jgi:hypothetical protein
VGAAKSSRRWSGLLNHINSDFLQVEVVLDPSPCFFCFLSSYGYTSTVTHKIKKKTHQVPYSAAALLHSEQRRWQAGLRVTKATRQSNSSVQDASHLCRMLPISARCIPFTDMDYTASLGKCARVS